LSSNIRWLAFGAGSGSSRFGLELRAKSNRELAHSAGSNIAMASLAVFTGAILYERRRSPLFCKISLLFFSGRFGDEPARFWSDLGSIISGRILANPKIDGRV
jgi:hypothetical protein